MYRSGCPGENSGCGDQICVAKCVPKTPPGICDYEFGGEASGFAFC